MRAFLQKTCPVVHRGLGSLACILALTTLVHPTWGQEEQISVQATVDRATINIGDVITYTLTITHAPAIVFQPPQLGAHHGPFEIRHRQVLPEQTLKDGSRQSQIRYAISTFTTGDLEIPAVEITYTDSLGRSATMSSEKVAIAVESLHPDEGGDIRDIKPPVDLPGTRASLYWLIGGLILAAAGTSLFVYIRRRRMARAPALIEYQGPPRPAHEIALEEINRIASLKLLQRGLIKQFYTEITEVIKRYIGRRYRIHTMELTTAELVAVMKKTSVPGEHIGLFEPFFQEGDLVKFAKHIPAEERMNGALEGGRQLILTTREEPVSDLADRAPSSDSKAPLATSVSGKE